MPYTDLLSFTREELIEYCSECGEKVFRGKQLYEWLHKKLATEWDGMSNISKSLKEQLSKKYALVPLNIVEKITSKVDGTIKYLMQTLDGGIIECVAMQYTYGMSVCISSQIGCRMGCKFCASTLSGLERNLLASEMLSQVYLIQKDTGNRVDNIVVMGIGEPFDNYKQLLKFIHMITDEYGLHISQRSITVSTCGVLDKMYEFANENLSVTLALSLHAPNDAIRKSFMPIANKYSIDELMKACKNYVNKTGRRVTFEYTLIEGVNDSLACARELASHLKGLLCHVNLIPLNEVSERNCKRSEQSNIYNFEKYLEKNRINVTIRKGMGGDIEAACGQLRRKYTAQ